MSGNNNRRGGDFSGQPVPQQQMQIIDMGEGLYVAPMIGNLFVGFQLFKAIDLLADAPDTLSGDRRFWQTVESSEENLRLISDPSAAVRMDLHTVGGKIEMTPAQSDRFLRMLGLRKNLVEVAPANAIS